MPLIWLRSCWETGQRRHDSISRLTVTASIGASEGHPVKKALVRPEMDGLTRAFPLYEIVMKLNPDYFFQTSKTYIRI